MCRFKSGIILKSKAVIAPGVNDRHSDLLEEMEIDDTFLNAKRVFVRAELVPERNEWWVSPKEQPEKWTFVVDQDIVPDWFDREEHEKMFREYVCDWWEVHVLVDKKLDELSSGFYMLKCCEVKKLCNDVLVFCDSSYVEKMHDNSRVEEMYDSSQVGRMCDSSQVGEMYGSSLVRRMCDSSQVKEMHGSSQVRRMWGNSQVEKMWDSSQVKEMYGNSQVEKMCDSSQVGNMYDSSQIRKMHGSSQVGRMYDSSHVGEMYGSSQIREMYGSSQVREMYGNSTARNFKNYPQIQIIVPDTGNFEMVVLRG